MSDDCQGHGYTVEPECCGDVTALGCCGNPIGVQVQCRGCPSCMPDEDSPDREEQRETLARLEEIDPFTEGGPF